MNHKRGRPKNRRGGCLMCKYYKVNGYSKAAKRRMHGAKRQAAAEARQVEGA